MPQSAELALDTAQHGDQEALVREILLVGRPASRAALYHVGAVAQLLRTLHRVSAGPAVAILARRAADRAALDAPHNVVALLNAFQLTGQHEAVVRLLARNPAQQVTLLRAGPVSELLGVLRDVGHPEVAAELGRRFATAAPLDEPRGLHHVFHALIQAGERESASILARRAVAHRVLRPLAETVVYTWEAVWLIGEFYQAGEEQAAVALAAQVLEEEGPVQPWRLSGASDLLAVA